VTRRCSRAARFSARSTLNKVRDALKNTAGVVGVRLPFPDGQHSERGAHRQWELLYESDLGQQSIKVEASLRPRLRPSRQVHLAQLLAEDTLIGSYAPASCYALDADEARAGADLSSRRFIRLVDAKLAEIDAPPLREQPASFGAAAGPRRRALEASVARELQAVLRIDEPPFDLEATFERFNALWGLYQR
jgi:hypothetical protein